MTRRQDTYQRLEREIAGEKAAALGRAGERLEHLLDEVALIGRRLDEAAGPEVRERLRAEYGAARRRALEARLALVIQREALGLRHHRAVDQQFPEPPPR